MYITSSKEMHGHFTLRTPVRHCELNPIELVWSKVKRTVANRNTSFRIRDVERLFHEELDVVTQADRSSCVRHVVDIEDKMKHLEGIVDIEPITFTLSDTDRSENDSMSDDNDG